LEGIQVGENHAIQCVFKGMMYNIWGMKELNYVMQTMAMGGLMGYNDLCRTIICWWNDGGG
jgi:hypothetical protein